jgi:hypothetical protein
MGETVDRKGGEQDGVEAKKASARRAIADLNRLWASLPPEVKAIHIRAMEAVGIDTSSGPRRGPDGRVLPNLRSSTPR